MLPGNGCADVDGHPYYIIRSPQRRLSACCGGRPRLSDLIQRARGGDRKAFDELVGTYEKRVWSLAYQIAGQVEDAQEITQEVFLRVHQYMARYDERRPFTSWLYRITVNCTYDYIKKRPTHTSLEDLPEGAVRMPPGKAGGGAHQQLADQEVRMAIRAALHQLTPQERAVFVFRDMEGLETKEIAYILRCTTITVRRHSSSARLKLRQALARRFPHLLFEREK